MPDIHCSTPQTLLGFDFGTKRIGVAVGQTLTRTATPLLTLKATQGIPSWEKIGSLIREWQPDALVVGIPIQKPPNPQHITQLAQEFAKSLEQFGLPVHLMDERLTTKEARQQLFDKGGYKALQKSAIDSFAAQLILETWLHHEPTNPE